MAHKTSQMHQARSYHDGSDIGTKSPSTALITVSRGVPRCQQWCGGQAGEESGSLDPDAGKRDRPNQTGATSVKLVDNRRRDGVDDVPQMSCVL